MTRPVWPILLPLLGLCMHARPSLGAEGPAAAVNSPAATFFEAKVRPVLVTRCYKCHGPESKPEGGLRLDSLAAMLQGGDSGPAIKPGDAKTSLLVDAINHGEIVQMPPKTKLPPQEIADLTAWVAQGAPWPDAPKPDPRRASEGAPTELSASDRAFWAFQSPQDVGIPSVKDAAWPQCALDRFVLASLEAHGLVPAPPADKRTLIRRATFDLHGLPPSAEQVDAFLADASPLAFARVVDQLLASPRYGERWGRHWLDLARYADSNGMDENMAMANAWRYRDYVLASFNDDIPYDQFVREQLAGDLLPSADHATSVRRLVATGFLVLGPKMLAEDDPVKMEMDIIDEQVDTIGRAFMGLTLGCARCHDHKFDPIPTTDYYSLAGIFKSTKSMENYRVVAMWSERPLATPDELAKLKRVDDDAAAASQKLKAAKDAAGDQLLAAARARLADYLLVATQRDKQRRDLTALAANLKAGQLGGGAVVIEAEKFARGNVIRDQTTYGPGIGVIYNAGTLPNFAEYDLDLAAAGTYQLALRYAAAESRPIEITLDGHPLASDAAHAATGSWQPDTQSWSIEGVVPLAAGKHVIRLQRDGPFPHLDKLALLPARFAKGATGETWSAVGQAPDDRQLNPVFLDQWERYLARTREDAGSVMRVWHAWHHAEGQGTVPQLDANTTVAQSLLGAPRPASLADLADRYANLCRDAEAAWQRDGRPAALSDPVQEAFRQVLVSANGPLAIPAKADERDGFYPPETRQSIALLNKQLESLEQARPTVAQALAVADRQPQNLKVHIRGSHLTLGDEVPRRFPRILAGDSQPPIGADASGRLELANWLARADHPLTSRVMVNRIWQSHFGEGLVRTSDNFGRLGERPDNQALLDWLSLRFVESGWSVKAMHRLVMLSSTYQMSTTYNARAAEVDPENRLLWRMNRRRLEAEEVRDAILAAGGQIDWTMGGTLLGHKNHTYVTSTASANDVNYENRRRSIYLPVVRSAVYDVLQAFDFADPSSINGKRSSTTVAPQALFMMNSALMLRQTRAMAEQLVNREATDDPGRVIAAYQNAYSRLPSPEETSRALQFVATYQSELAARKIDLQQARVRAWQALCRVILSSNEFIFVE